MITGFIGKPGSGKSLRLCELAVKDLIAGHDVYTNFNLRWLNIVLYAWRRSGRPWEGWAGARSCVRGQWRVVRTYADMGDVAEGRLYFDEAHIWLWSRAWAELPRDVVSWWSQSRKHGVDVFWAAQRMNSIDAHVRELTAEVWHCRRLFNTDRFIYQLEDMESSDRGRRIWKRHLVRLNPELAACYSTREVLAAPYELEASGGIRARAGRPVKPAAARRAPGQRREPGTRAKHLGHAPARHPIGRGGAERAKPLTAGVGSIGSPR